MFIYDSTPHPAFGHHNLDEGVFDRNSPKPGAEILFSIGFYFHGPGKRNLSRFLICVHNELTGVVEQQTKEQPSWI